MTKAKLLEEFEMFVRSCIDGEGFFIPPSFSAYERATKCLPDFNPRLRK